MAAPNSDTHPVALNSLRNKTLPLISALVASSEKPLESLNVPLWQSRFPPMVAPISDTLPVALNPLSNKTSLST